MVFAIHDTLPKKAVVTSQHNLDWIWQDHRELEDTETSGWGLLYRLDREYLDNRATSSLCSWSLAANEQYSDDDGMDEGH